MAKDNLTGKIAVITGGARGIGYAIAERFLEAGIRVVFCGLRQESVDASAASLSPRGEVAGVKADVASLDDVRRLVATAVERFGGVDILVNNCGIRTYKPVGELDPEEWNRTMAVNLNGAFYTSHEVLPIFKQRGGGDIVNISSLSSTSPFAGGSAYTASKAGLNILSDATFLDHRYDGVRVTEVLPGSTDTDFNGDKGKDWKIAPEDIAEVVVNLLQMPRRTTVCRVDLKPTAPPRK